MRTTGRAAGAGADVSSFPGGSHNLANEGVRLAPGATSIANTAKLDTDVVVVHAQGCSPLRQCGDGGRRIEIVGGSIGSAGTGVQRDRKIACCDQPLAPRRRRRFYLAIRRSVPLRPHASLPNPHQPAKACEPCPNPSLRPPLRRSAHEQTIAMRRCHHWTLTHHTGLLQPSCIRTD
jgi:hypothetical protein